MTTVQVTTDSEFTAADRCDRCPAQAYARVTLASGGELLFCGHHIREHAEKLRRIAITIHDESSRLEDAAVEVAAGSGASALKLVDELFEWLRDNSFWTNPAHVRADDVNRKLKDVEAQALQELGSSGLPDDFRDAVTSAQKYVNLGGSINQEVIEMGLAALKDALSTSASE